MSVDQSIQPSSLLLFGFHICSLTVNQHLLEQNRDLWLLHLLATFFVVSGSWQEKLLHNYTPTSSYAYCYTLNMKALLSFKMSGNTNLLLLWLHIMSSEYLVNKYLEGQKNEDGDNTFTVAYQKVMQMNNYTCVTSVDCNWLGRHALLPGSPTSRVKQTQNLMFILILAYKHNTLYVEGTSISKSSPPPQH